MNGNIENKKNIIKIISLILFVIFVIGISYAYFMTEKESEEQTITSGTLGLTFTESSTLRLTNNIPLRDADVEQSASSIEFIIENTGNVDMYTSINLESVTMTDTLKIANFRWALYEGDKKITTGNFSGGKSTYNLANNLLIRAERTKRYTVRIWLKSTNEDQSSLAGATFSATVTAKGYSSELKTLASKVLGKNNSNVITTTSPTFSETSTDRGLFVQQDDLKKSEMGFPTYYFRGSSTNTSINPDYIMNNYVKFGKYQTTDGGNTVGEDIIWRIVRINEDGSIRLITENAIANDIVFNAKFESKYINDDGTDSEVKTTVETWYENNIGNNNYLDEKIITSSFCSDRSGISNVNVGNAYNRLNETPNPIFTCPDGAVNISSKVGLLTADEVVYTGSILSQNVNNNSSYLYDNRISSWTLTPTMYTNVFEFYSMNNNTSALFGTASNNSENVRAVINLSPDVTVIAGDGLSKDTAYKIR